MTDPTLPDLNAAALQFSDMFGFAMKEIMTAIRQIAVTIADPWKALTDNHGDWLLTVADIKCAMMWAERHHPEWVRILRRTKKTRTRIKYANRIMREWRIYNHAESEKKRRGV